MSDPDATIVAGEEATPSSASKKMRISTTESKSGGGGGASSSSGSSKPSSSLPQSVVVQFASLEGEDMGPQIDLPTDSKVEQLEELLNQLRGTGDSVKVREETRFYGYNTNPTTTTTTPPAPDILLPLLLSDLRE